MKRLLTFGIILMLPIFLQAQIQIGAGVSSMDFSTYTGSGFVPSPNSGELDSDDIIVTGMSNGDGTFGGTHTSGDLARGQASGPLGTGGCYAFDLAGNIFFAIQPGGSDFTEGTIVIKLQNATGDALTKLNYSFDLFFNNDQVRSQLFNLEYSIDNITYNAIPGAPTLYTPADPDGLGWQSVTVAGDITTLAVPAGDFIYFRIYSDDFSGGGSRDEIGMDNILFSGGDVPLPVELTSFTASVISDAVQLNWETRSEVNNFGFEIERSEDNTNWSQIDFVKGHGTSNIVNSYSYTDDNTVDAKLYYRLKQVDNDGQFTYSNIVEANVGTPVKYELEQNYPNPFNPSTTIKFSVPEAGNVNLTVYNSLGEQVAELINQHVESGFNTVNFNANNLSSGIYFYTLQTNKFTATKKMMLLK